MSSYNSSTLADLRGVSTAAMKKAYAARLREAAEVIAIKAREISSTFSHRIPGTIKVKGGISGVYIEAGGIGGKIAPNAYAFEDGVAHPLFGNRHHWYKQPHKPFLDEAGEAAIEDAAEAFSKVFDDWCEELDL